MTDVAEAAADAVRTAFILLQIVSPESSSFLIGYTEIVRSFAVYAVLTITRKPLFVLNTVPAAMFLGKAAMFKVLSPIFASADKDNSAFPKSKTVSAISAIGRASTLTDVAPTAATAEVVMVFVTPE